MCKMVMVAAVVVVAAMLMAAVRAPAAEAMGNQGLRTLWGDSPRVKLKMAVLGRALVLRSELDITTEQREQIRAIVVAHRAAIAEAVKPVVEKRRALGEAVRAGQPDERTIRRIAAELGQAAGDAAVTAARVRGEVARVLTAEQLKLIEQFHAGNATAVTEFLEGLGGE